MATAPVAFVSIPFIPVLQKICDSLGFSQPVYDQIDDVKNVASVVVQTSDSPVAYRIVSDEMETLHECFESVAQQMCVFLVGVFKVVVFDVNLEYRVESEKCAQLFELKRNLLERVKQQLPPLTCYGLHPVKGVDYGDAQVNVGFLEVLKTVVAKLEIGVTPVEVMPFGENMFVSWLTVASPGFAFPTVPVVGYPCPCIYTAKESMAKKAIDVMMKIYSFAVVDVNHYFLSDATASYANERVQYIYVKERLYRHKENEEPFPVVSDGGPVTARGVHVKCYLAANRPLPFPSVEVGNSSTSSSTIDPETVLPTAVSSVPPAAVIPKDEEE